MTNLSIEIITVISCSLLYIVAWQKHLQGNHNLGLLLLAGFILRLFMANDWYLHEWDERFHALASKNMIDYPFQPMLYVDPIVPSTPGDWDVNHIWLRKQPFPLWMMALSMAIFGVNELALRLPSVLLSTIGIWGVFYIASNWFNKRIAFVAAFLFSIHGLIIELAGGRVATDHVDVFFMVLIELSICAVIAFSQKKQIFYLVLGGILAGLAVLSKWLPAFIVFPIAALQLLQHRQFTKLAIAGYISLLFLICCATFLPWQLYIYYHFPKGFAEVQLHNYRHITEVLDGQTGPFYYYFKKLLEIYGELVFVPVLFFLFVLIKKRKSIPFFILNIWLWIPLLFFSFVKTKMQAYTLFVAPSLFIMTAYFWNWLKIRHKKLNLPTAFSRLLLLLLLLLPVRYSLERLKLFQNRPNTAEWAIELKSLNQQIKEKNKVIVYNCHHFIEAMFYTPFTCYPYNPPDTKKKEELSKKGYIIYVLKNGKAERVI